MEELFDREAIAINRTGRLTANQRKLLSADSNPMMWPIMTVFLGLVGAIFYALLSSPDRDGSLRNMVLVIVGLCMLFSIWRSIRQLLLRRKLFSDELQTETGTVRFTKLDAFDRLRYSPETDGGVRLYRGGLAGLSANLPPGRYRFYYLPTQRWLLSAEPISSLEELTRSYNEILAEYFKFSQEDLHKYREMAQTGQVLVVDGPFSVPVENIISDAESIDMPIRCMIGNIPFLIAGKMIAVFLCKVQHRAYYYPARQENSILGPLAVEVLYKPVG